jgi:hypothetical protein
MGRPFQDRRQGDSHAIQIVVKASAESEAGVMPEQRVFDEMTDYHEELKKAGVLLDALGLQPSSKGFRIKYSGGKRSFVDGPFAETKELIAGYTLIQVKSRDEAIDWAQRFPNPGNADGEIEVRQVFELDDFQPNDAIERFRQIVGGT